MKKTIFIILLSIDILAASAVKTKGPENHHTFHLPNQLRLYTGVTGQFNKKQFHHLKQKGHFRRFTDKYMSLFDALGAKLICKEQPPQKLKAQIYPMVHDLGEIMEECGLTFCPPQHIYISKGPAILMP